MFDGEASLKECFLESCRFSEDLDLTVRNEAHLDEGFRSRSSPKSAPGFTRRPESKSGSTGRNSIPYRNPRRNLSCQAAINYKAPASPIRLLRRIKLGHAAGGHVVPPETVEIVHPILTRREEGSEVLAYDYIEVLAERSGALAEPTRPRDLYDVVTLYRNADAHPSRNSFPLCCARNARSKVSRCHNLPISSRLAAMSKPVAPAY
ncbi:nucleotidyl transferase AbiEii/AbiGii toxin family protein [Bradyrhizobium sp. B120]|uniref:nucleotidyl transferase AbiEii/AbiGii toxin family protein n=1 Tax=Bradyrhizobium sp. B120 TaxID=3410088 RepID=UPI003B987195